jgi:hypothetical protein
LWQGSRKKQTQKNPQRQIGGAADFFLLVYNP